MKSQVNTTLIYLTIGLSLILVGTFTTFPFLDIKFSSLFYDSIQGFVYKKFVFVRFLYLSVPLLTKLLSGCFGIYLLWQLVKRKSYHAVLTSKISYLLVAAILGPGLIVNSVLKENIGRARPLHIAEFNGGLEFSPALFPSNQCSHNCSFPSGHAAMAFYFTALAYAYVLRNNEKQESAVEENGTKDFSIIYSAGFLFGWLVGFIRIIMGGHFLSDVAASCVIILLTNHVLYLAWQKMKAT